MPKPNPRLIALRKRRASLPDPIKRREYALTDIENVRVALFIKQIRREK